MPREGIVQSKEVRNLSKSEASAALRLFIFGLISAGVFVGVSLSEHKTQLSNVAFALFVAFVAAAASRRCASPSVDLLEPDQDSVGHVDYGQALADYSQKIQKVVMLTGAGAILTALPILAGLMTEVQLPDTELFEIIKASLGNLVLYAPVWLFAAALSGQLTIDNISKLTSGDNVVED